MKKPRMGKWVAGIAPGDRTEKAARRTLEARLAAVEHYLRLAARKADANVEYVHNLRICTRRATAALELYDDLLPRRRAAWLRKRLKRIRRAAGDARDYDVLAGFLTHDPLPRLYTRCLQRIRRKRQDAQKSLAAMHERLTRGNRLHRRIKKLRRHIRRGRKTEMPPFGQWAHMRLRPVVHGFFAAAPDGEANLEALHRFRIRGKNLRYAMEMLAGAFPPGFRRELYPLAASLQDRLGGINDLVTAQAQVRQLLDETDVAAERKHLRRLLAREQARLEQARREFLEWFPPHLEALRDGFGELLKPTLASRRDMQGHKAHVG